MYSRQVSQKVTLTRIKERGVFCKLGLYETAWFLDMSNNILYRRIDLNKYIDVMKHVYN